MWIGAASGVIAILVLVIMFAHDPGNTARTASRRVPDREDDVTEESSGEPDPEEVRIQRVQETFEALKQFRDANPDEASDIFARYERLLVFAQGTYMESGIRKDFNAYKQEVEARKQLKYWEQTKQIQDDLINSRFFSALSRCIEVFKNEELTDLQKNQIKQFVRDIAQKADQHYNMTVDDAEALCAKHEYGKAEALLNKRAETYGLVPHEHLDTLKIKPYSEMLTDKLTEVQERKKRHNQSERIKVKHITEQARTFLMNMAFKQAEEVCSKHIDSITIKELKNETKDLHDFSSKLAGIKKRMIDLLNAKPHYTSEFKGTIVKADEGGIFLNVQKNSGAVLKLAWKNISNDKLFHILRISGVVRSDQDKRTMGRYFKLIGDRKHAQLYLDGLK